MKQALSLRLRITLFVIVAIMLILGAATYLIDARVDTEVAQRADANLLERAQALSDIFNEQHAAGAIDFPSGRIPAFLADDGLVYFVIDCGGQHVASSRTAAAMPWPASVAGSPVFADLTDAQETSLRAVVLRFAQGSILSPAPAEGAGNPRQQLPAQTCSLGLAANGTEVEQFQGSLDLILIGCILLAIVVVAMLVPLLVGRGLRPLALLADAMRDIGPDAPERRLGDANADELQPLIVRFNEVLSRMQQGLLRERQFASSVAHELRTPLAELRTLIEVELRYPSGLDARTMLADIGSIGVEMERMVEALLLLTRIEGGIEQIHHQPVDVAMLTHTLRERHRHEAERRRLDLQMQIEDTVVWQGDAALLEILLGNLLGNAIAYAPPGSRVLVDCSRAAWWVQNVAPALAADDVQSMGQRFWRKGRDAGVHTGLGLSLAEATARAQSLQLHLMLEHGQLRASVSPQTTDRSPSTTNSATT